MDIRPARHLLKKGRIPLPGAGFLPALVLLTGLSLTACQRTAMPKPVAPPRLSYPEVGYTRFCAPDCPFQFDYPAFLTVTIKPTNDNTIHWIDFRWEQVGLTIYTTYLTNSRHHKTEDDWAVMASLLKEKQPKGNSVTVYEQPVTAQGWTPYIFEVDGPSPTPLEFIVTDGLNFSFSGRLLFDSIPDKEAMTDILHGLRDDMLHLMSSFTLTHTP